jgi:hypothetical protein
MLETMGTKRSVFDTLPNDTERLGLGILPRHTKHLDILDTLTNYTKYANTLQELPNDRKRQEISKALPKNIKLPDTSETLSSDIKTARSVADGTR